MKTKKNVVYFNPSKILISSFYILKRSCLVLHKTHGSSVSILKDGKMAFLFYWYLPLHYLLPSPLSTSAICLLIRGQGKVNKLLKKKPDNGEKYPYHCSKYVRMKAEWFVLYQEELHVSLWMDSWPLFPNKQLKEKC